MALTIERIGELSSKNTIFGWFGGLAWMGFFANDVSGVIWWEWLVLIFGGMFAASVVIGGGLAAFAAIVTKLYTGKSDGSPHAFAIAALISPVLAIYATGPAVRYFANPHGTSELAAVHPSKDSAEKLRGLYLSKLDDWVNSGGPMDQVQSHVVENCGKLVFVTASAAETKSLVIENREEFDFRVDVCTKLFINKIHPQPEFDNPKIVTSICDNGQPLFEVLCQRTGLR